MIRRSIYFSEKNMELYEFLLEQKNPNQFIIDLLSSAKENKNLTTGQDNNLIQEISKLKEEIFELKRFKNEIMERINSQGIKDTPPTNKFSSLDNF